MPFNPFTRYAAIGSAIVMALLLAWALRLDQLRARYLDRLNAIVVVLGEAGYVKPSHAKAAADVRALAATRDKYRAERDQARSLVDVQSNSITRLEQETAAATRESQANRKLAEEAARQRDIWIARARAAATRTERLSAEEEVRECEQVLDSLYQQGF